MAYIRSLGLRRASSCAQRYSLYLQQGLPSVGCIYRRLRTVAGALGRLRSFSRQLERTLGSLRRLTFFFVEKALFPECRLQVVQPSGFFVIFGEERPLYPVRIAALN